MLSVELLALAAALFFNPANRQANRTLAAFLFITVGELMPYTIGFAGFYDAWMWLTFAPFAQPLFLAPLLFGYTHILATGLQPRAWAWHLLPGFAHLSYSSAAFLLPFEFKMRFAELVDGPIVSPLVSFAVLIGLVAYSAASLRLLTKFRASLADHRSDDDLFSARWLGRILAAMILIAGLWAGWQVWKLASGFDYFEFFGLHLALGLVAVVLGAEGWRHAERKFIPPDQDQAEFGTAAGSDLSEPDWSGIGADYAARTAAAEWWREPDLDLAGLARRLGTNTGRLSRAVNLGLGMNFSTFINRFRAEAVAGVLAQRPVKDLLDLAFEMGFASKASFNRAFLARYGVSPSAYRRGDGNRASKHDYLAADPEMRRSEL